jgi:hypothetical protein
MRLHIFTYSEHVAVYAKHMRPIMLWFLRPAILPHLLIRVQICTISTIKLAKSKPALGIEHGKTCLTASLGISFSIYIFLLRLCFNQAHIGNILHCKLLLSQKSIRQPLRSSGGTR